MDKLHISRLPTPVLYFSWKKFLILRFRMSLSLSRQKNFTKINIIWHLLTSFFSNLALNLSSSEASGMVKIRIYQIGSVNCWQLSHMILLLPEKFTRSKPSKYFLSLILDHQQQMTQNVKCRFPWSREVSKVLARFHCILVLQVLPGVIAENRICVNSEQSRCDHQLPTIMCVYIRMFVYIC